MLNGFPHGRATSSELSALTGLHRTTVRRMLETLVAEKYVHRSESDDSFRLTFKVRQLSEGFVGSDRLSTIAPTVMGELMQRVVWPSDLSVPDGDAMIVTETTHRFSPLSFHRSMVGRRLPFLLTAAGRAYLAYCPEQECEQILQMLRVGDDAQAPLANDARFVRNLLKTVRANGFGSNIGEWTIDRKIGAIAMPVRDEQRVIGSLSVVYLPQAIASDEAIQKFAPPLKAAVDKISALLREQAKPV